MSKLHRNIPFGTKRQIHAWKKRGIENVVNGFQIKPKSKDPDNQDLTKQVDKFIFSYHWRPYHQVNELRA